MPVLKYLGDRPPAPDGRQVPSLPTSKQADPPIQTDRWFRNRRAPDAKVFNQMCAGLNAALLFRTKEAFSSGTVLGQSSGIPVSSAGAGDRARFRFAFHLSPYTHALLVRAIMYPQSSGFTSNAYARLDIYSDDTESTLVASQTFYYGANPLQSANVTGWQHLKVVDRFVDGLTADTTYYAKVTDVDNGLIQSICACDLQSMSENYDGYLPQTFNDRSQLLDAYRSNLVEPLRPMWRRGGSKVLNWTVDAQASPRTNATQTSTNIIDGSSTTYGDSIPGYTLNMTGKSRLSQTTGVPCKIFAYLDSTSANNGRITLHSSDGTGLASVDYTGLANTPKWFSATVTLPASESKYYITSRQTTAAATVSVHAVSVIEYET